MCVISKEPFLQQTKQNKTNKRFPNCPLPESAFILNSSTLKSTFLRIFLFSLESSNHTLCSICNTIRRKVKLLKKTRQRSTLTKRFHTNEPSIKSQIFMPSKVTRKFNSYPRTALQQSHPLQHLQYDQAKS
mmetsp:Transcript_35525/g.53755  ORF Transcript_35525/g.53755 Transcript_35525/m.53755 type:complete len:131 (+) Transcript_35525:1223-1615(+)